MLVDGGLIELLSLALLGSLFCIGGVFNARYGDGDKKYIKNLAITALALPLSAFFLLADSDELTCTAFESGLKPFPKDDPLKITPRDSVSFPLYVDLKLYRDHRAYWIGGPTGKNIDFSDVRGNFTDNEYGDLFDWNSLTYASWVGVYASCDGGALDCIIFASYAPQNRNLSVIKKSFIDNWVPLPTEGDLLILSSLSEHAFYGCVDLSI